MRTTDEIRELIERFYDGMTDEAEEKWLKTYFSSGEVAEELKSEKTMFLALQQVDVSAPAQLEKRIERQINQWNMVDMSARRTATRLNLRWIVGIAASLILLFSVGIFIYHQEKEAS